MILNIYFKLHYIGTLVIPYLWILDIKFLLLYILIILSWKLNKNICIISQLEYILTGRTFQGIGKKYYVPRKHRYILYSNFIIGLLYNCYYEINKINKINNKKI